jgi:hypothetical protein
MTMPNVEYSRLLYASVLDWYKVADQKAQLILGANGAFITVVTGLAFSNHSDLESITRAFDPLTWALLSAMAIAVVGSFVCALSCLWSRTYSQSELENRVESLGSARPPFRHFSPGAMWFFQLITTLDQNKFAEELATFNGEKEVLTLAVEIPQLSRNVVAKHRWVNYGFVLAGATPLLFLASLASYIPNL